MKAKLCELCNNEASFYCGADSAFLCKNCDTQVHHANFLVARHVRQVLCPTCKRVTTDSISGTGSYPPHNPPCYACSCSPDMIPSDSSGSSDCVSTTASSAAKKIFNEGHKQKMINKTSCCSKRVDAKAEGVFVIWCKRLGLNGSGGSSSSEVVVSLACDALGLCLERLVAVLPFRVCLAASFWLGLRLSGDRSVSTWQNLKRFELVSGVPAKLIVAVEVKLARALRVRTARHDDHAEEGWAES